MIRKSVFNLTLSFLILAFAGNARADLWTWTFEGEITQTLSSLQGFTIGESFTFTLEFDSSVPGTQNPQFTRYDTGVATFSSSENAVDMVARVLISDAPNLMTINLEPPDATMFQLELTNIPGEFREAGRISIVLPFGGVGSEDIRDYIVLTLPADPANRRIEIVFPAFGAIAGRVDSFEAMSVVPGVQHPVLLLLPLVFVGGLLLHFPMRKRPQP